MRFNLFGDAVAVLLFPLPYAPDELIHGQAVLRVIPSARDYAPPASGGDSRVIRARQE